MTTISGCSRPDTPSRQLCAVGRVENSATRREHRGLLPTWTDRQEFVPRPRQPAHLATSGIGPSRRHISRTSLMLASRARMNFRRAELLRSNCAIIYVHVRDSTCECDRVDVQEYTVGHCVRDRPRVRRGHLKLCLTLHCVTTALQSHCDTAHENALCGSQRTASYANQLSR
jgi:hypothetical protein